MKRASGDTTTAAIDIQHLSKHYAGATDRALDDLTLQVYPGEVYGFLGPNGAGKSTTIRLLLNFIQPSTGTAQIRGYDVVTDSEKVRSSIGYLAGDVPVYPKMTGRRYLHYLATLQGQNCHKAIGDLSDRLDADLDIHLGDLSRGNRQKIGIIQTFMHQPRIYILDEPTTGLDPIMQEVFYDLVYEARKSGAAVFLSSHILGEVQKLCDRIGIIRQGRLVQEKTISDLLGDAAQTFVISFAGPAPVAELRHVTGTRILEHHGNHITVQVKGPLVQLLKALSHHDVKTLHSSNLELEADFLQLYEGEVNP